MEYNKIIFIIYSCFIVFMTLTTLFLFFKDKSMAKKNQGPNRIKEKTLLGFSALGGAIGALIGSLLFHHKTNKIYFTITIYFSLLIDLALFGFLFYLAFI